MKQDIPGTILFDGTQAQKGLALKPHALLLFNSAENRAAFVRDEDAYCGKSASARSNEPRSRAEACSR